MPTIIAATSIGHKPRAGGLLIWVLVAILAGLIFRFGTAGLADGAVKLLHLFQPPVPDAPPGEMPDDHLPKVDALLFVSVLLGAAVEEFSYRRILQSYFCRKYGLWAGIVGVSVAFGAIHGSAVIMLAGFCLALLYLYSGRLWVAIVAHATANLAAHAIANLQPNEETLVVTCSLSAVVLVVALGIAINTIRRSPQIYD